jgi:flavin reductase (DIM6/NTAB) family NADH-FMN oxidoreductase RutF
MSEEILKLDMRDVDAVQSLPPGPVFLLAVGDKEQDVSAIGMFNVYSNDPTIVGIGVRSSRHSYKLLEETGDFSLNLPGKELLEKVIKCGQVSGSKVNKFKEVGLTPLKAKRIKSPVIAECLMNIEVKCTETIDRGDYDHIWYIGKVVHTDIVQNYDRTNALIYRDGEFSLPGKVLKTL